MQAPEEKIGEARLGSDDMTANFGITFFLATAALILLVVLVSIIILLSSRTKLSRKNQERKKKLKDKILYNPIIRFAFLSALKTNLSSILALKSEESSPG